MARLIVFEPNSLGSACNAATWTLTAVAISAFDPSVSLNLAKYTTVFIVLRLISRSIASRITFGLDDVFILLAGLMLVATNIALSVAVAAGEGKHWRNLTVEAQSDAGAKLAILSACVIWAASMPKLAVLSLLQRIFAIPRLLLISFWILAGINIALTLITSVLVWEQCDPPSHQWDIRVPGKCLPVIIFASFGYASAALSTFLDFTFAVYPQFLIWRLRMQLRRKIGYGLALGLGVLGFTVSLYKLARYPTTFEELRTDLTHASIEICLLGMLETDLLIASACLPTFGPLYRFLKHRVLGSTHRQLSSREYTENFTRTVDTRQANALAHTNYLGDINGLTVTHVEEQEGPEEIQDIESDIKKLQVPSTAILKTIDIHQSQEVNSQAHQLNGAEQLGLNV